MVRVPTKVLESQPGTLVYIIGGYVKAPHEGRVWMGISQEAGSATGLSPGEGGSLSSAGSVTLVWS